MFFSIHIIKNIFGLLNMIIPIYLRGCPKSNLQVGHVRYLPFGLPRVSDSWDLVITYSSVYNKPTDSPSTRCTISKRPVISSC